MDVNYTDSKKLGAQQNFLRNAESEPRKHLLGIRINQTSAALFLRLTGNSFLSSAFFQKEHLESAPD